MCILAVVSVCVLVVPHCTAGTDRNRLTAKRKTAGRGLTRQEGGEEGEGVEFKGTVLPCY